MKNQGSRRNLELAGLTDEEGKLRANVRGSNEIWVPPEVTVNTWPSVKNQPIPCIQYPLPKEWENVPLEQSYYIGYDLTTAGWRRKDSLAGGSDRLLEDFIRVAEGTTQSVINFVLKWGPLWRCLLHRDCCWKPKSPFLKLETPCRWFPAEPIEVFVARARQVRAAFEAAAYLRRNEPVPAEYGLALSWAEWQWRWDLTAQRSFLAKKIEEHLGSPNLRVKWSDESQATLSIDSGFGFLPAVWLGVAQVITEARGLYICDGCSTPYIRQKRRPRKGERNYCNTCGSRGSKKDWARQQRKCS